MNENIFKRNEKLAKKVIEGLKSRNMTGYYASSKEDALEIALDLIPEGSKVGKGGAQSVVDIGLDAALKSGNYDYVANRSFETNKEGYMFSYMSDVFIGSTNAITEDGILVNIDGTGLSAAEIKGIIGKEVNQMPKRIMEALNYERL